MNTRMQPCIKSSHLAEISLILRQILLYRDQTILMARLQAVSFSEIDPELGKAWRNRMIVRSRLKKYASAQ